ncbi:MAG: SpoIIE family protein phosphatase [Crocinitomix sp.]|nr:SpoIIE family protein phosphatase [Crocinitomix sp.]
MPLVSHKVDYNYIYESFPDMCLSLNPATGKIISFNKTLLDTLGYTGEEIYNSTLFDLYAENEADKVKANLISLGQNRSPKYSDFILKKKNGELLEVTLKLTFVKDDLGNILYSNAVWRDVTALKNVERALALERKKVDAQNILISEQHQNFVDSISYAKRIQEGMLPASSEINAVFPNNFIYYRPKGIVSGDFYWMYEKRDQVVFSVADCTGHGVPGALMSMAGIALFDQIVAEQDIYCAGIIMNKIRTGIIKALKQGHTDSTNSDGMDAGLCVYNKTNKILQFAGANNSLIIIREKGDPLLDEKGNNYPIYSEDESFALYEIKGQRQPLGYYFGMGLLFEKKQIQLKENDRLYLYSDGFQDQLGGDKEKVKKYLSKRFKEMLLTQASASFCELKGILDSIHKSWKGETNEQTDDICIWGIQV